MPVVKIRSCRSQSPSQISRCDHDNINNWTISGSQLVNHIVTRAVTLDRISTTRKFGKLLALSRGKQIASSSTSRLEPGWSMGRTLEQRQARCSSPYDYESCGMCNSGRFRVGHFRILILYFAY